MCPVSWLLHHRNRHVPLHLPVQESATFLASLRGHVFGVALTRVHPGVMRGSFKHCNFPKVRPMTRPPSLIPTPTIPAQLLSPCFPLPNCLGIGHFSCPVQESCFGGRLDPCWPGVRMHFSKTSTFMGPSYDSPPFPCARCHGSCTIGIALLQAT